MRENDNEVEVLVNCSGTFNGFTRRGAQGILSATALERRIQGHNNKLVLSKVPTLWYLSKIPDTETLQVIKSCGFSRGVSLHIGRSWPASQDRANHSQVHIGTFSGREPDQSSNNITDDGVNGRCNPTAPRAPVVRGATEISELLSNLSRVRAAKRGGKVKGLW